jgi:hypothetical protein
MGCYFYSLENRLIDTAGFQLCYNSHKHAPDQDSTLDRTQPCGPMQLLGPWPWQIFVVSLGGFGFLVVDLTFSLLSPILTFLPLVVSACDG